MIKFDRFTLKNGLRVIVHKDVNTPIVAVNIIYNVGARDENPKETGFAHLFEHLMFGGSINIPTYDEPLQQVGGENNAFTSNDITNYYITIPKENIETAFWLESDRMLSLAFSEKSLEVQKNVVIEEFKQRYLNQPYGDIWLLLRPMAYKKHSYKWATIGKSIKHIENANMQQVKDFFYSHYAPNNAILVVAGDVDTENIKALSEKWFGQIELRNVKVRNLPKEPLQRKERIKSVTRNVPFNSIIKAFHMCNRLDSNYYVLDVISDLLSGGKSSRFYKKLVKEKKIFSEIDAYITGNIDDGLFVIQGTLYEGISMKKAEQAINSEIEKLILNGASEYELNKIKNKVESSLAFSEINVLNKAMNLAFFELIGDADLFNQETENYAKVDNAIIKKLAKRYLRKSNCSTLYYYRKNESEKT
ncbi:MAG: peptidase M16 [Bacteroidetes bacterium GWA2_31_9]|nr:MAG: peptidase M16 [Bacteroidetes bacterium GWA2_31_9]